MADANLILIFIDFNKKLCATFNNYKPFISNLFWYASCINLLIYVMFKTRPDIIFIVFCLNYYMTQLGSAYIKTAKRILRYLKNIFNFEFIYKGDLQSLFGYINTDWTEDINIK